MGVSSNSASNLLSVTDGRMDHIVDRQTGEIGLYGQRVGRIESVRTDRPKEGIGSLWTDRQIGEIRSMRTDR